MKIKTFDLGTWVYPDTEITECDNTISLDSAKNSDTCFQVLMDLKCEKDTPITWTLDTPDEGITVVVHEMRPALVKYNSGAQNYNAIDWDNVKDFVVRRAPYEVYELTRPIEDGKIWGEMPNTALFIRLDVAKTAVAGKKDITLKLNIGGEEAEIKIDLHVHKATVCDVEDTPYPMGFWICPQLMHNLHGVERGTEEYYHYVEVTLKQMKGMRCNHIQLPTPTPIRDEENKVIDFDFTEVERITEIALKLGFRYINSGFVAKWLAWKDNNFSLQWDSEERVDTLEAYRQYKIYIEKTKKYIEKYDIADKYWQSFVDEPQLANSMAYKSLSSIFRRAMPEIKIMDPVETPNVVGSCDVWIVKQAVYEKYKEQYNMLMEMGETVWVYSCGFPANKWMNHIIDLPLSATRLINWMGIRYGIDGFLHYGYHEFLDYMDPMYDTNFGRIFQKEQRYFPPGNGQVVYSDGKVLYDSVRAHVHRTAAAEAELLMALRAKDKDACYEIIDGVCTTFEEYTTDSVKVENARKALLDKLDLYC
jgi:hypothetical protein